ncbi:MAG: peroxiredoxin [Myxococcales bacterium]|nr:peroxiredoxin [Myxococcales bacterium]
MTVGDPAPAFELDADNGKTYSLTRLHGKRVVLYFYPRDNTPGCTTEACDFRDLHDDFKSANTIVLGVSSDSVDSHKKFRAKLDLPFPLLSDPSNKIATAYGAYGKKKGGTDLGSIRSTFIISPEGRIETMYTAVRVKGHAKTVLQQAQEAA